MSSRGGRLAGLSVLPQRGKPGTKSRAGCSRSRDRGHIGARFLQLSKRAANANGAHLALSGPCSRHSFADQNRNGHGQGAFPWSSGRHPTCSFAGRTDGVGRGARVPGLPRGRSVLPGHSGKGEGPVEGSRAPSGSPAPRLAGSPPSPSPIASLPSSRKTWAFPWATRSDSATGPLRKRLSRS